MLVSIYPLFIGHNLSIFPPYHPKTASILTLIPLGPIGPGRPSSP